MPRKKSRIVRLTKHIYPQKSRCQVVAAAKRRFVETFKDFHDEMKRSAPLINRFNKDDRPFEIPRGLSSQPLKPADIDKYANPLSRYKLREAAKLHRLSPNPMHMQIEDLLGRDHRCFPDLDQVSETWAYPGKLISLKGNCFGSAHGNVAFQVAPSKIYQPPIFEWSSTEILVDYQGEAFPGNRPYDGRVWVIDATGYTSNALPVRTFPQYTRRFHDWDKLIFGWMWGNTADGTYLKNKQINDPDFVISVYREHLLDGWSKLTQPWAGGQKLGQGYHIGVDAGHKAWMWLHYSLDGPIGIPSPHVEGVEWSEPYPIQLHAFSLLGLV